MLEVIEALIEQARRSLSTLRERVLAAVVRLIETRGWLAGDAA